MTARHSTYGALLLDYLPRPIRTPRAYQKALRQVEELMTRPHLGRAESELVELLATLIEQYEAHEHPTPATTPAAMLEHLLEARDLSQEELARATSIPRSVVTSFLAGRRPLGAAHALRLSRYLRVAPDLFAE